MPAPQHPGRSGAAGAARPEPQYTELLRMPQQSTMLRIISKICGEGTGGQAVRTRGGLWARGAPRTLPLTMITATTMAAMPMRYSFPEKSSSIFWWQSACGARPARGQGHRPPPGEA